MLGTFAFVAWKSFSGVSFAALRPGPSAPARTAAPLGGVPPAGAPPADVGSAGAPLRTPEPPLSVEMSDLDRLRGRALLLPVPGIAPSSLRNDYLDERGQGKHEALDIAAPRGTPVLAVDDGRIEKLFTSVRGGLTVYQFDPEQVYCYYYAHLDRYAEGLSEGRQVRKGDPIGYVGTTGNAPQETPHLHFAIFKLGPEKRWWEGVAINPFPLWSGAGASATQ
jgi:peptidoglycan LD-endopeptidase LytH